MDATSPGSIARLDQWIAAARNGDKEAEQVLRGLIHTAIEKVSLETVIEVLLKIAEGKE